MKKTKTNYNLYLFYNDTYICSNQTVGDDWEKVYNQMSLKVIKECMEINNFKHIITTCTAFCDKIEKQKRHCEKIKITDLMMFISCYFILYKFQKIDSCNFMFLKRKNKKRVYNKI